ncbi:MAG: bifunctional methylenetetrahydrofolate dehydrogenase/methenyltetrahydrofolate cyclohydrolase [Chloroflexota bacterium]
MSARILDGKIIANKILDSVRERTLILRRHSIEPHLVFVTVGNSAPAQMYANRLEKLANRCGICMSRRELAEDVSLSNLDAEVADINSDEALDGLIVQMPLPDHLTSADLSAIIDPRKDVDGITVQNAGKLYLGIPGPVASTATAMMEILFASGIDPLGCHAVVVGRSHVVGHPVAELLLARDATVTVTHRATRNLGEMTRRADILMVGAGEPHLITPDMIRPGVVIVDAGINVTPDGLVGDVDFAGCLPFASALSPVPGGVGPVTNVVLLRNVVNSAEQRLA